jgi:hypothetical protein
MEPVLNAVQTLAAIAELEPRHRLTYRQLRDLEFRGCVKPTALVGAKGPRVYDVREVLLLRLIARLQADEMLSRWQAWSVVAHLRNELLDVLLSGASRVLVIQGAVGRIMNAREADTSSGVPVDVSDIGRGVRDVMRRHRGDVWNGWMWVPAREARAYTRELVTA